MKCPNCGHEAREGQVYCTNCGTRLPREEEPGVGETPQGGGPHAAARPNICPVCGSALPDGSEFCPNCGTRLAVSGANVGAEDSMSHTQAMPVLPEKPARREAVPSPPRTPYKSSSRTRRETGGQGKHSRKPLVVLGSIAAAIVVVVAVVAALGAGPLESATTEASNQGQQSVSETSNGSVSSNDSAADASEASANANTSDNTNTQASDTSDASNAASSSNANASAAANNITDADTAADASSGSVSISGGYVYNSNSTYGYSLTVPTTFELTGSDSNGNATLTDTASPCVITVSVDDNPNGYTVDEALADASRGASSGAYTAEGNGWYVFSDEPNGTVYYIMSYVREGRTISLRFTYPTSAKSQCDPIIESVQPTFSVN